MREPLSVNLRPYVSGGHPKDRVDTYDYKINGVELQSASMYAKVEDLTAGKYIFELLVTSNFGETMFQKQEFEVVKNQIPTCDISWRETVGSYLIYADCDDNDGRVRTFEWTIAGEVRSLASYRLSISKKEGQEPIDIVLRGVDDSGAFSEPVKTTIAP
jgi:hypothetical protein